jgi:hypothetical protein
MSDYTGSRGDIKFTVIWFPCKDSVRTYSNLLSNGYRLEIILAVKRPGREADKSPA